MKIGIIGAMEDEVAALKEAMEGSGTERIAGMEFTEGLLEGREVIVVRSGVGKVNAAVCAQTLADHFQADVLINTGIAGSLDARIDIGDMVISTDAVYHDVDAGTFGYAPGQVPQMETFSFPAEESLIRKAVAANQAANPQIHTFTGRIASGDQFVGDQAKKDWIRDTFQAMCVEMEGAAIAHTAYLNNLSYVIIRAISDKADNSAVEDYPVFEQKAIAHSVALVREMLRRW